MPLTRQAPVREIRCPMDGELLDEHTNDDLVTCDEAAMTYYEIMQVPKTRVSPETKVKGIFHDSWHFRLKEEYLG